MDQAFDGRVLADALTPAGPYASGSRADTTGGFGHPPLVIDHRARALALWPRLDRARLTRTQGDPIRIARLVTHRTSLTFDGILAILMKDEPDDGGPDRRRHGG